MELVQERHRKRLDALDEVNASLMRFNHDFDHLIQGRDMYARSLETSHGSARDLSRKYETLLGDRFYQAVLRYTDAGKHVLQSSFTLTNENLMHLEQRGFDTSVLDQLRKVLGHRIPVAEARRFLQELEANINMGQRHAILSVAQMSGGINLDDYHKARAQYLQIKEEILRTVPPLS